MGDGRTCRACGSSDLQPAGEPPGRRAVCAVCGRCWEDGGDGDLVDPLSCPGCARQGRCESCPTWLVEEMSHRHVLTDGQEVLIRPLLYGDRFELAEGFAGLSPASRRHRFFNPPDELGPDDLDYLTNLDYRDHFACVAVFEDRPVPKGVGVARYLREADDPTVAEVAVTVIDEYQRRGIGTLLTRSLGEVAAANGIRSFVNYVQWENADVIAGLTAERSRITPAEPGIARIEVELPERVADVPDPYVHRVLRAYVERMRAFGHRGAPASQAARGPGPVCVDGGPGRVSPSTRDRRRTAPRRPAAPGRSPRAPG